MGNLRRNYKTAWKSGSAPPRADLASPLTPASRDSYHRFSLFSLFSFFSPFLPSLAMAPPNLSGPDRTEECCSRRTLKDRLDSSGLLLPDFSYFLLSVLPSTGCLLGLSLLDKDDFFPLLLCSCTACFFELKR